MEVRVVRTKKRVHVCGSVESDNAAATAAAVTEYYYDLYDS